jgi:hypothetical protein
MPVIATNPTTDSVSILFADPNSLLTPTQLKENDAICLDLDSCGFEPDGSLGSKCVTLIHTAKANKVDVILAAKTKRFFEVPGLDKFAVTFVLKPVADMTGHALVAWVTQELVRAMGLGNGRKRGFRSSKPVGNSTPGKVSEAYLQSHLTKEQEEVFLDYVSGKRAQTHHTVPAKTPPKKIAVAKSGQFVAKNLLGTKGKVNLKGQASATIQNAAAVKVVKSAKTQSLRTAASAASGTGSRKKG